MTFSGTTSGGVLEGPSVLVAMIGLEINVGTSLIGGLGPLATITIDFGGCGAVLFGGASTTAKGFLWRTMGFGIGLLSVFERIIELIAEWFGWAVGP